MKRFFLRLMKNMQIALVLFISCFCQANDRHDFAAHLKKDTEKKTEKSSIKNIDFIYLINLDQRPEKLEKCLSQLKPYGISPHRFSAIYGWALSAETFNELGVKFLPGMLCDEWVIHFPLKEQSTPKYDFLREECYGKSFFSRWMTPGAIGCTLSHLSVLQDAYDSGYQTIWIMEDDISVERDPKQLSSLIKKLDNLVGKEGWDILYTDIDTSDKALYTEENDFESDLKGDLWFFWRPDIDLSNRSSFAKRTILSEDFIKIGSRMRTHSMIIRRSGMKKILDFIKEHHIFIPYDHELAIVPGIRLISLRYNLVTHLPSHSDIKVNSLDEKDIWEKHKQAVLNEFPQILGWRDPQKAEKIMEFIRETKPKTCVEIGAFGGAITYPIAATLGFLKEGVVYAIDAWNTSVAIEGLQNEKSIQWWKNLNMETIHQHFLDLVSRKGLHHCRPIKQRSQDAVSLFSNDSIDFLFLDGNVSRKGSLEDARLYLPKVKEGGYIWLNHADSLEKNSTVAFLMKHCKWIQEKSLGVNCVLFQKTCRAKEGFANLDSARRSKVETKCSDRRSSDPNEREEENRFGKATANPNSQNLTERGIKNDLRDQRIHEHGYWIGTDILNEHKFDKQLALGLAQFFKKESAESVVDFGCGTGEYVKLLNDSEIECMGYDGNPDSAKISGGIVKVLDLSQPFHLDKSFDWVLSIEVGEHLPKEYEKTFIENLHRHNKKGIILSWAVKGQGGFGHFNEQDNPYIKEIMTQYGYENDLEAEKHLRTVASLPWFKNTIMVFRKSYQ